MKLPVLGQIKDARDFFEHLKTCQYCRPKAIAAHHLQEKLRQHWEATKK